MIFHKTMVLCTVAVAATWAAPIVVNNPSFEVLPDTGLSTCGTDCMGSAAPIPGWINGGDSGQFQPGTQLGNLTRFSSLSDGITSAYSNDVNGTIAQFEVATVQAGVLYTLTVDIGDRNDTPATGSAFLLVNGNYYGSVGAYVPGGWGTF